MDCAAASTPTARTVHKLQKGQVRIPAYPCIPAAWNHEDRLYKNTKLLHFTDIDRQPWRQDGHPLQDVWEELKARHG